MEYPDSEIVTVNMDMILFDELYENEVGSLELEDLSSEGFSGAYIQFLQAMVAAKKNHTYEIVEVEMTQDALDHLLQDILPENMEMWYNWSTEEGNDLLNYGKDIYREFDTFCPY